VVYSDKWRVMIDKMSVMIDECVCCFVLLIRGWRRLETKPPVTLMSSVEFLAFTMSLSFPMIEIIARQIAGDNDW